MTSSEHRDLGPELRQLAQAILDRLDPVVRAAAAMAGDALRAPGKCQQVWCPVCALAALAAGEQHPMLNLVAEHSGTLLAVIRSMVAEPQAPAPQTTAPQTPAPQTTAPQAPAPQPDAAEGHPPPSSSVRFHHIPIVIETDTDPAQDTADHDVDV